MFWNSILMRVLMVGRRAGDIQLASWICRLNCRVDRERHMVASTEHGCRQLFAASHFFPLGKVVVLMAALERFRAFAFVPRRFQNPSFTGRRSKPSQKVNRFA